MELGKEMGLRGEELGQIYLAGLLHDVGKIGVKDTILQKRGPLTPEEQEQVRLHVTIGYWILAELKPIRHLLPGVLHHHERYDGMGYPAGLARDQIPLLARILAVADAYDAMSHQRPYRESLPYRRVEETLIKGAGTQWDKEIIDAFLRCRQRIQVVSRRPINSALREAVATTLANNNTPFIGPHSEKRPRGLYLTAAANRRDAYANGGGQAVPRNGQGKNGRRVLHQKWPFPLLARSQVHLPDWRKARASANAVRPTGSPTRAAPTRTPWCRRFFEPELAMVSPVYGWRTNVYYSSCSLTECRNLCW